MTTRHLFLLLPALAQACFGQITNVNVGVTPNDRTGDPFRTAFQKLNANDNWLAFQIAAEINARSNQVGVLNSLVAAQSNQVAALQGGTNLAAGVWLWHQSATVFCGADAGAFLNAYNAARDGDEIFLGPGRYDLGTYFTATKSVSITGAGAGVWDTTANQFSGGTILRGEMMILPTATNCTLRSFAVENWGDVLVSGASPSNSMNLRCQDVAVGCLAGTNGHNFLASGANWEISRLRSYNGGYHGIVFKGASNAIASDLLSWNNRGAAMTIKASGKQNGNLHNITVQNLLSVNSGPVIVQAVDAPSTLSNVTLRALTIQGANAASQSFMVQCDAGCTLGGLHVAEAQLDRGQLAVIGMGSTNFWEVTFDNCQLNAAPESTYNIFAFAAAVPGDLTQFRARNVRVNQVVVDQVGNVAQARAAFASARGVFLSAGLNASVLRLVYVLNGRIYVAWPASWPLATSFIAAGDPVRLADGPLAGVYTNTGVLVAAADNNPVPGAHAGDFYMILGPTSAANGLSPNVDVAPGKVMGRIAKLSDSASASVQATGGGVNNIANTFESGTASCILAYDAGNTVAFGGVNLGVLQPAIFPAYGFAWTAGDHVDLGVFGGNTVKQVWYPSYFRDLYLDVMVRGRLPGVIVAASAW